MRVWLLPFLMAACSASPPPAPRAIVRAALPDAAVDATPAPDAPEEPEELGCDDRVAAMVARLERLAVNGRFEDAYVGVAAVADQPAPQTLWLVSLGTESQIDIRTVDAAIESSSPRLGRDLDAARAKHARPIAYRALWNDRVAEARRIVRALSIHGPALVLVERGDARLPEDEAHSAARGAIRSKILDCRNSLDQSYSQLDRGVVKLLARALRACNCRDLDTIEHAVETLAQPRGLFVLTYDRRGRSLGRFAADALFEDVLRAAEAVPLDERTRGVRF